MAIHLRPVSRVALVLSLALTAPALAQQQGLTVSFTTTPAGGNYSPKNIVAVWIETSSGVFTKTIGRWAQTQKADLVAWRTKAGTSDTDAMSGATRPNHTTPPTLTATWDLKNKSGVVVPDGTYTIRMELADRNSTATTQNNQGTFTFVKGATSSHQTTSGGGFNGVVIDYVPLGPVVDAGAGGGGGGVKDAGSGGGGGVKDAGTGGGAGGAGGGAATGGGAGGSGGGTSAGGAGGAAGGGGAMTDGGGCSAAVSAWPAVVGVLSMLGLRRRKQAREPNS